MLDSHIFGGIPLKHIDFTHPEIYQQLTYKNPRDKKEVYFAQKEKMEFLLKTYDRSDFQKIRMYDLNSVQLQLLLESPSFVKGVASEEKVVQAVHFLSKQREVKFHNPKMLRNVVSQLIEGKEPRILQASLSYFTTLIHSLNKIKFTDKVMWN